MDYNLQNWSLNTLDRYTLRAEPLIDILWTVLITTVSGGYLNHPGNLKHGAKSCISFQPVNEIYSFFQLLFTDYLRNKSDENLTMLINSLPMEEEKHWKNQCVNKNITLRQSTKTNLFKFCACVYEEFNVHNSNFCTEKRKLWIVIELESLFSLFHFLCVIM